MRLTSHQTLPPFEFVTSVVGRIISLRKEANLTQKQFAEKIGWSVDKVGRIERQLQAITLRDVITIAKLLGVSMNEIVFGNTSMNTNTSYGIGVKYGMD